MKKNLLLLLFVLSGTLISGAQERVNATLPKISDVSKGKITEATGWMKFDSGEWVSRKNRIPWNTDKALVDFEYYGLGEDRENFIYIDVRDVNINDSSYTILIKKYKDGYYKYESIRKGWMPQNSLKYYVFKTSELEKLKNLPPDVTHNIKITSLYSNTISYLSPSASFKTIEQDLYKKVQENSPIGRDDLGVFVRAYKDNIRFVVADFGTNEYYIPDFNKKYYETTKLNFAKFLQL